MSGARRQCLYPFTTATREGLPRPASKAVRQAPRIIDNDYLLVLGFGVQTGSQKQPSPVWAMLYKSPFRLTAQTGAQPLFCPAAVNS